MAIFISVAVVTVIGAGVAVGGIMAKTHAAKYAADAAKEGALGTANANREVGLATTANQKEVDLAMNKTNSDLGNRAQDSSDRFSENMINEENKLAAMTNDFDNSYDMEVQSAYSDDGSFETEGSYSYNMGEDAYISDSESVYS